jgi:hypothetical protein
VIGGINIVTDYSYLREEYLEIISQDQLYRICRISKRKATWLLENGFILCKDSGKKTRRFKIRIDDVIIYLTKIEKHSESLRTPPGIFSSGAKYRPIKKMQELIDSKRFTKILKKKWSNFPDALTVSDVMELIGYSQSTISDWVMQEKILGIRYYNRYLIPKDSLIKYLACDGQNNIQQKSKKHKDLI